MLSIDTTRKMADLIQEHPEVGAILAEMGIECGNCLASQVDTLEDVVRMYKLDMKQLLLKMRDYVEAGQKGNLVSTPDPKQTGSV
ncbi:MAG: DUF1858 domain-containing protein [Magnetococcales bacterium]|nr:DUF1858 domain-containing protein [Magnetococcales bacterium]